MAERTQLNVNISPELLKVLKQNAIKSGSTLAKYVTQIIQSYVSKEDVIEDENLIDKRINSIESQLNEISEKLNNFNSMKSNTSYKEEKEKISTLEASPKNAAKPKKPSAADVKRIGILAAKHFKNIQREEVLSSKEAWKLFIESEFSQMIKTDHLDAILDVLRGESVLTFEAMSEIYLEYGGCPVVKAFRKISELPIDGEFAQLVREAELYIANIATQKNKSFEMSELDV